MIFLNKFFINKPYSIDTQKQNSDYLVSNIKIEKKTKDFNLNERIEIKPEKNELVSAFT